MITRGAQKPRDISNILIRDISGPLLETFHSRHLRIPFSVKCKICKNFLFLRFLTVLNNPKFCYVMYVIGETPGICDDRSILSYLPILAYKCIRYSKILDCLELLRTEEIENFLKISL